MIVRKILRLVPIRCCHELITGNVPTEWRINVRRVEGIRSLQHRVILLEELVSLTKLLRSVIKRHLFLSRDFRAHRVVLLVKSIQSSKAVGRIISAAPILVLLTTHIVALLELACNLMILAARQPRILKWFLHRRHRLRKGLIVENRVSYAAELKKRLSLRNLRRIVMSQNLAVGANCKRANEEQCDLEHGCVCNIS